MNNFKLKKIVVLLGVSCASFSATQAYAIFGVLDSAMDGAANVVFNIVKFVQEGISYITEKMLSFKEKETDMVIRGRLFELEKLYENAIKNLPDIRSCEISRDSNAVLVASSTASTQLAKMVAEVVKSSRTQKEEATRIADLKNQTKNLSTCTTDKKSKNIDACKDATINQDTAGQDSNPRFKTSPKVVNEQGELVKTYGTTIPSDMGKGADGQTINGASIANKNLSTLYFSSAPALMENENANNSQIGQKYNNMRETYFARLNTPKAIEAEYIAQRTELPEQEIKGNSSNEQAAIYSLWDEVKLSGKEIYGPNFVATKRPSYFGVLEAVIEKNFTSLAAQKNMLGQGATEKSLLALQTKIMFEQLKTQQDTNRLLGVMIAQQMAPVTIQDLSNLQQNSLTNAVSTTNTTK